MAMRSDSSFLDTNPRGLSNRIEGTAEGYKKQAKLDGIPEAGRSLFSSEDHLILSLEKQWPDVWPFEKHLPGEHSSYQKLPEGGWITGIQAVENRGIDLRLFYREPDETNIWGTIDGACRLSDSASIGTGFGLSAHGGAIETILDEATAELGKIEAFPFLATRSISFQIRRPVPVNTTLSVKCNVESVKGLKCTVHGTIENPVDGIVLASCDAELVNMASLLKVT
eukprot:jgi/Picsp_1/5884/NSC_03241-R1_glycosyltransferase family 77 protein